MWRYEEPLHIAGSRAMLRIQGAEAASGLGSDIRTVAVLSQLIVSQSRKEQQDDSCLAIVICID